MGCTAHSPASAGGKLLGWVKSPDGEATVKACGVVVAMVQGHSWVPIPSTGSRMNVGTVRLSRADAAASGALAGWTHGLLIGSGGAEGP